MKKTSLLIISISVLSFLINLSVFAQKNKDKKLKETVNVKSSEEVLNASNQKDVPVIDSIKVKINKLGPNINTPFDEYAPTISADGLVLFFTSRKPFTDKEKAKNKPSKEKIYVSKRNSASEEWGPAIPLSDSINIPTKNVSNIAISNDGQRLLIYFDDKGNGEIYESVLRGTEWSAPKSLGAPINTPYHESSASFSPDGKTIYFISNRKGGKGGRDIWVSTRLDNGSWTEPKNLSELNTPEDEEAVYLHPDGKTLYFSSKGYKGLGGYDIFISKFENGEWQTPVNIGPPLNTAGDDYFLVVNAEGTIGYMASSGDSKNRDIYEVIFEKKKAILNLVKGTVKDADTKQFLEAQITSKIMPAEELFGKYTSNKSTGEYLVALPGGKQYQMVWDANDYAPYDEDFDLTTLTEYKEQIMDIELFKKDTFDRYMNISGYVTDANGQPIKQVTVILKAKDGSLQRQTLTAENGYFIFKRVARNKDYDIIVDYPMDYTVSGKVLDLYNKRGIKDQKIHDQTTGADGSYQFKIEQGGLEKYLIPFSKENIPNSAQFDENTFKRFLDKYGNYQHPDLSYKVQVGAYENPQNFGKAYKKQFEKLDKLEDLKLEDNLTRFNLFTGIPTYNQALVKRDEARKLDPRDAFITIYFKGQRMLISKEILKVLVN
ncbi:MAG: hypothetical protein KatS3mg027_1271 [Bacteroidia bacterium]|nr:MAG: hypothetical protein KatS3mg027_1271 [Bacteroidia bacterium]